jgi:hypothetical protein
MKKGSACRPRESNNSTVQPSRQEAFSIYDQVITALNTGSTQSARLSSATQYSNALRCHLLGRHPTSNVSWNDIVVAKLQHDVPHLHVPRDGSMLLTMSQCKVDRKSRCANLDASVRVLINNQPEGDRMFIGGDRLVANVVFALHGLDNHGNPISNKAGKSGSNNNTNLLHLDFETRLSIMTESIRIRKAKNSSGIGRRFLRVTKDDATEAFLHVSTIRKSTAKLNLNPGLSSTHDSQRLLSRLSQKQYFEGTADFASKL